MDHSANRYICRTSSHRWPWVKREKIASVLNLITRYQKHMFSFYSIIWATDSIIWRIGDVKNITEKVYFLGFDVEPNVVPFVSVQQSSNTYFKKTGRHFVSFCGAIDTPVLDFWWCLPWVSKPAWQPMICEKLTVSPHWTIILQNCLCLCDIYVWLLIHAWMILSNSSNSSNLTRNPELWKVLVVLKIIKQELLVHVWLRSQR